ncbi:hypothetical protein [Rhizobium mongolense]
MSDIVERLRFLSAQNRDSRHLKMAYAMDDAADLITSLRANIDRLTSNPADHRYWEGRYRDEKAENEELQAWAKSVTTAISDAIGLGSEMFRRHGEQYRIDPAFVAEYIRGRRKDHHESMHRNIRRIRELEAQIASLKGGA